MLLRKLGSQKQNKTKKPNQTRAHSVIYVLKEISGDLRSREYIIERNV